MAFDWPRFMEDRRNGLPVSELDKDEFQLYNVVQAVSMDPKMRKVAHELNELTFSRLPKDIQALAMQGLNCVRMDTRWSRVKTSAINEKKELVERIMKVTGLSHNDVVRSLPYRVFDLEKIEEKYIRLYEPEKILELYGKKKRASGRKVHAAKVNGHGK